MHIVLIGPPGSGKGTQAARLVSALQLTHLATGDLFRQNLEKRTELGERAHAYMSRGELVPDALTIEMLHARLERGGLGAGVVFDGFPRTIPQAHALDALLAGMQRRLDGVIHLDVDDEAIVERLSGRLVCRTCQAPFHVRSNPFVRCPTGECRGEQLYQREDDREETIRARLGTYHAQTRPLLDYYRASTTVATVCADATVDEVAAAALRAARDLSRPLKTL
jgi:adenylate kinase